VLPLDVDTEDGKQFSFSGDINTLEFVAAMPASAARLGLQIFLAVLLTQNYWP
jgi:hypothetical protein